MFKNDWMLTNAWQELVFEVKHTLMIYPWCNVRSYNNYHNCKWTYNLSRHWFAFFLFFFFKFQLILLSFLAFLFMVHLCMDWICILTKRTISCNPLWTRIFVVHLIWSDKQNEKVERFSGWCYISGNVVDFYKEYSP